MKRDERPTAIEIRHAVRRYVTYEWDCPVGECGAGEGSLETRAEGERAATERMADDWYEMRDVLQSTVDSLESALRRVEFYEVDRPRKPKQHRTVQRARALLARTADAIERGEHE